MPDTPLIDVAIPLEAAAADALRDERLRSLVGAYLSRMLHPGAAVELADAAQALREDAARRGLTDAVLDAELAAYNAERRGHAGS